MIAENKPCGKHKFITLTHFVQQDDLHFSVLTLAHISLCLVDTWYTKCLI